MPAKVANVNFVVDHRYVDGGRCKILIPSFLIAFEYPEQYLNLATYEVKK